MLLTAVVEVDTKDFANEEETTGTEELNVVWTFIDVGNSSVDDAVVEARYVNIETDIDCCIDVDLEDDLCKVIGDDSSCGVVVTLIWNVGAEDVTPLVNKIEEEETPGEAKLEFLSNEVESNILV